MRIWIFLFAVFLLVWCPTANGQPSKTGFSAADLGKQIIVEGWAVNSKIGALLVGADFELWIDGLYSWPDGYYSGGSKGKKVRVSGILTEDKGLPVFIPRTGELPVQGIPLPEGTDLEKAKHRYILKNAKWEMVKD